MSIKHLKKLGIDGPKKGKYVVIICSKWCKSCKLLSNSLEKFRDIGLIELKEIDIGENAKLAQELNIYSVPALLFFKDGKLLKKNLDINGETFVKKGIMTGAFNSVILKEIIERI